MSRQTTRKMRTRTQMKTDWRRVLTLSNLIHLEFLCWSCFLFLPLSPVQKLLLEKGCLIVLREPAKQSPAWTSITLPTCYTDIWKCFIWAVYYHSKSTRGHNNTRNNLKCLCPIIPTIFKRQLQDQKTNATMHATNYATSFPNSATALLWPTTHTHSGTSLFVQEASNGFTLQLL